MQYFQDAFETGKDNAITELVSPQWRSSEQSVWIFEASKVAGYPQSELGPRILSSPVISGDTAEESNVIYKDSQSCLDL